MVSPTLGVGSLTCLPTTKSACCGVTVAAALLLLVSGSNWSACLIVAVLMAPLGLTTWAVKVTVSPTLGVGSFTVLARARSACCGITVALAVLLAVSGSNWSAWLIVAVFVSALGLTTRAVMVKVGTTERPTVPTVHTPAAKDPWLGVALTRISPAGKASATVTLVAASGPWLVRATVKVTVLPTLGVGLFTVLDSARSACCGVTVEPALLLPGSGSYWSDAVMMAVFVEALALTTRA